MSMRAGPSNSSSSNNSSNINSNNNSSNHMSSKRGGGDGGGSRRITESSFGSATTTSISTNFNQSQQMADKSAVKRKKRRKDEEKAETTAVVERVPVVLLTRLEDERKSNEKKINNLHVSDVKVVIERTDDIIESIRASSSDKLVPVGKKSTRHPIHRSNEILASSNAKTLEPISEEKNKYQEAEETVKNPSKQSIKAPSKKKEVVSEETVITAIKKKEVAVEKSGKASLKKKEVVVEECVKVPSKKKDVVAEESVKAPSKKKDKKVEVSIEAPLKENVKAPSKKKDAVAEESAKAASKKKDKKAEESIDAPSKESVKVPSKKKEVVVEESVKAPSKKNDKVAEESVEVLSKQSVKVRSKKNEVVVEESVKSPLKKKDKGTEESVKPPSKKKEVVVEESVKAPLKKKEVVVEEKVKIPQKRKELVVKESVKKVLKEDTTEVIIKESVKETLEKKKKEVVVDEMVKAQPKKSSTKKSDQTESKSSEVKIDQKLMNSPAECNVYNVNNDNLNKIDPKIIERQLLVRIDRSEVEDFLKEKHLQRLQSKDKLVVETNKNHSENKTQDNDVPLEAFKEIKTCAIPSDTGVVDETEIQNKLVKQPSVDDITNKIEEVQQNTKESVEIEVKKSGRSRKAKKEEETAENVVKNERLSSREKRKVKSQDIAGKSNKDDSDKDLRDDTRTSYVSSVQMNKNQIEHLDDSSKDTSCESAKSNKLTRRRSLSKSKSLNESAVVDSEKKSSKKTKRDKVSNKKIIELNSIDDHSITNKNSNIVDVAEPVPLPMEVDAIPSLEPTIVDDSKAEDNSVQQICDIHSKNVIGNAKSSTEETETVDESTNEILSECAQTLAENLVVSQSSESPIENLINSNDFECPAKNIEENETSKLSSMNIVDSETSELPVIKLVNDNDATVSPTDSFVSCENAEPTNEISSNDENNVSFIETIEDTESTTSTCTLIEETPEELSRNLEKDFEEELSENLDKQPEINNELVEKDVQTETKAVNELPQVAEKEVESPEDDSADSHLKADSLDESLSQDKIAENNEHESTFENNLKSVENLVIDSILNGEIVSPKIIAQSTTSRVEEVQTFVFEGGVDDFVNDIEVPKEVSSSLEPTTSTGENLEPLPVVEESSIAETLEPSISTEKTAHVENAELSLPVEIPMTEETLPLEPLPIVEQTPVEALTAIEEPTTETTLLSLPVTEETTTNKIPTSIEEPVDEEFTKHRRKHTLSELKKKCIENLDKHQAEEFQNTCTSVELEESLPANIFNESLVSSESFLEQTVATSEGFFENISDTESEICLSDRLNRLSNLKIPSFEDSSLAEKSVLSEDEDNSRDTTKRQRILMKITKTDANKHVTHLVESKEEEARNEQPTTADQVTEGEIKIIMRKESSTNSHVIKEIKIIPRTPEGGNSARIPGYSPTSSDLSSGNSSCRVPSCSPAKPDSGSYRMPGWSPASTEIGQTTIKKKQGRPKKYPIFTDAELIAKTTAIVNNVDVHASELTEKPLFEPVESIRINEDNEIDTEEEHQTIITNQMCLSGDQLLDAMPAQPVELAKYAKEIEENQNLQVKKKKIGRPRKKPLNDDIVGANATKVTENITVGRIKFNVIDSIEELVEPVKQINPNDISATQVNPIKKQRGRPKNIPSQNDNVLLEKSTGEDFSMTEDETADDDSDDKPYSERVGLKSRKYLNEHSQLSENQIANEAEATTEDYNDSFQIKPRVERKDRKQWKHLKNASMLEENSMRENDASNSSLFTKPKVEKKGRKPWKQLKSIVALVNDEVSATDERQSNEHLSNDSALSENQVTEEETSITENEGLSDAPVSKRKGERKPWKCLKNLLPLPVSEVENEVTEEETSMTENESISDVLMVPKVQKRGRKPWKHLKNIFPSQDGEPPTVQEQQSNDDSALSENPSIERKVERRGRKLWKQLKKLQNSEAPNAQKQQSDNDSTMSVTEEETSMTENESISDVPVIKKIERRGRKPWKHLENLEASLNAQEQQSTLNDNSVLSENQFVKGETSMTEIEGLSYAPVTKNVERRGRVTWKHLKNLNALQDCETPAAQEQQLNKPLNAPVEIVKKKMGRPRKYPITENQLVEKTSAVIEAQPVYDKSSVEPVVNNQEQVASEAKQHCEIPLSEYVATTEATKSVVEDESVNNTSVNENVNDSEGHQSLKLTQDYHSAFLDTVVDDTTSSIKNQITNDTEVTVKKKRSRRSLKNMEDVSEANSMTEDESADDTIDESAVEEQEPSKHSNDEHTLSENQFAETENSTTENWDADDTSLIKPTEKKKRGRKSCKHLIEKSTLPVVVSKEKKRRGRPPKNSINISALLENQIVEKANSIVEDKSVNDTLTVEPNVSSVVENRTINEIPTVESLVEKKNTNAQTEDETVSSTEDIPAVDRVVQKKRVRFSTNISEDTSSQTEDETVSSTEDIPKVDHQPVMKKKPGRPRTKPLKVPPLFGSPRKRGRPAKIYQMADSSLPDSAAPLDTTEDETVSSTEDIPTIEQQNTIGVLPVPSAAEEDMSESLAASSIENLSNLEIPSPKKRDRKQHLQDDSTFEDQISSIAASPMEDLSAIPNKRGRKPRIIQDDSTYSDSLAASSMEGLSGLVPAIGPKKRNRKSRPKIQDPELLAASSVEDLSTLSPVKRKPGRPSKNLSSIKITLPKTPQNLIADMTNESIEEFSPVKQLSPSKKHKHYSLTSDDDNVTPKVLEQVAETLYQSTFDNDQPAYDRSVTSMSPVKKKGRPGRPPKYPRTDTEESQIDNYSTSEPSSSPEKRRGRPPRRLSQDENILPSIINHHNDMQSCEKPGRSPRRLSHDSSVLPTSVFLQNQQQNEGEDMPAIPSLGKRQGRPPRKFSPDEEHSFSVLPHSNHDSDSSSAHVKRQGRPPRKYSQDDILPFSQSSISDSDETKRKGRKPKKFITEDESDTSLVVKKKPGRKPRIIHEEILIPASKSPISDTENTNDSTTNKGAILANLLQGDKIPAVVSQPISTPPPDLPIIDTRTQLPTTKPSQERVATPTISTTNLLRQQRKPKMSQPQQSQAQVQAPVLVPTPIVTPIITNNVTKTEVTSPSVNVVKKRGRQAKLSIFEAALAQSKKHEIELPGNLTMEQLRQRRHSQDDSMFSEELPKVFKERPKEFEDVQPKRKRGRPRIHELPRQFPIKPLKTQLTVETTEQAVSTDDNSMIKETPKSRMGRPRRVSPEKIVAATTTAVAIVPEPAPERTPELTAADYLRSWTDRDESPNSQTTKKSIQHRRFSQDGNTFILGGSRPLSRNRLRRYSQGDTLEGSSDDDLLTSKRKRSRSSGSNDSIIQDEKRPRVEKELCTQHSITKELVVQLTKIEESPPPPSSHLPAIAPAPGPISLSVPQCEPIHEIVKMNLRRKLEGNNSGGGPPPLVPIEPKIQPATHNDAKLLMLMQPTEEKALLQPQPQHIQPAPQHIQPAPQQFCIIFIPDALTSAESALNKDSQPTATIVNFQPVPDSELANKSVIYTPTTTPTKIFVNDEQHNRSFLCTTCTQALDLIGRLEANVGMTEEDKSAIKCPFCSNDFQSLFYLEYHLRQEHLKCENEKQCRHSGFNTLRIPSHDASSESEIYITFALKCRSCYELFENVLTLNEHVKVKHANLIRHKPPLSQFSTTGMVCYPSPPFKNGTRNEVLVCPSDCICRIGIRSTDSPMQRAQVLKRCPNFMRRLEKIEAAAYEVYTCTLCKSTFLMKDEVVEHLMKMHEVSCKFPCTKCLTSFRAVQMQENHHCSETTIRDLDKLINIVILPTDKAHDNSKFEDSSNDELGPIKTTPPPAVPSASAPLNGIKRKNGVVIQRLSNYLSMQPPKKPKLDTTSTTPVAPTTKKKLKKTPCPKCQKKFAYRKSLNDHITFEHIIPCKADEAYKNMAVELLRLVNNGGHDVAKIKELASTLAKYTDDDGVSLTKLTMINDEQENWNDAQRADAADKDLLQCSKCKANFKMPANSANLSRRNNHQSTDSPAPQLCQSCDPTRRRRNVVNNGHKVNLRKTTPNGEQKILPKPPQQPQQLQLQLQQIVRYTYECNLCGDSFLTTIELNRHKNDEHSNKPSEALKCEICSKVFYAEAMLEKHKKMHHDDSLSNSHIEDNENMECNNQSVGDVSKDSEANDTANSSTSRRDSTDNTKEEECKCPYCDFSAEKVSLKNHLKRAHGVMAFICQFCGKLLIEISEVRHMLDYHIKSTRKNGNVGLEKSRDDVSNLLKTLGKKRLHSLMMYHDFEGKCNNAIMRCPMCPEQFATRESCRHHYQWVHDDVCILCDATFAEGKYAGQHKVAVHNSIASYVWAIQRLVSAIVHSLKLDRAHPSNVLYQEVSMRLDVLEEESNVVLEGELTVARNNNAKNGTEEAVPEPFLEPVVLSEDQLPGSGNMIEVVIGNDMVVEDSEDNLLENLYLSPNYESSCVQPKILDAGAPIPELEEEEEVITTTIAMATTTTATCANIAVPTTPTLTSSNGILIPTTPVTAETYTTSAVFKLRNTDTGQEEVVLAITDEDLVTYRDDIGSLAERLSATCDSLSLEEITTMLKSYFENIGTPQAVEEVELANAIEPRTQ